MEKSTPSPAHPLTPATAEERIYAPPCWFDVAIGYWTGEPDREALRRAVTTLVETLPGPWHADAPAHEFAEEESLEASAAIERLFDDDAASGIRCRATGLRVRRCRLDHLHVFGHAGSPPRVGEPGTRAAGGGERSPEAEAIVESILIAAGLTRLERCPEER